MWFWTKKECPIDKQYWKLSNDDKSVTFVNDKDFFVIKVLSAQNHLLQFEDFTKTDDW